MLRPLRSTTAALAVVLAATLTGPAGQARAPQAVEPRAPQVVYGTQFDHINDWYAQPNGKKSQSEYHAYNLWPTQGALQVVTRRHCAAPGVALTQANASAKRCNTYGETRYSTGRAHIDLRVPRKRGFEVEFSTLLPGKPVAGTRQALWMHSLRKGDQYCDQKGRGMPELDILEWYGSRPGRSTSTTHLGCMKRKPLKSYREMSAKPVDTGVWQRWMVRRKGRTISYFRIQGDGSTTRLGRHTCGTGKFKALSNKSCNRMLRHGKWRLIVNGEVFGGKKGPRWAQPFPVQKMYLDWVQVRAL